MQDSPDQCPMPIKKDQCRSMPIKLSQYFSIKINVYHWWSIPDKAELIGHWSVLIDIDRHWSTLVMRSSNKSTSDSTWPCLVVKIKCFGYAVLPPLVMYWQFLTLSEFELKFWNTLKRTFLLKIHLPHPTVGFHCYIWHIEAVNTNQKIYILQWWNVVYMGIKINCTCCMWHST